ncbi:unnamed protein product, partial [Arctogadus glacialis]
CASDPPLCCLGRDDSCSRVCFCDVACLRIGDCCSDFNATCITGANPSCFNGCFCDESCASRPIPDCCPDYSDTCMIETVPTTPPEATISKPFTAELTNQTTAEFQELQTTVVTFCDAIFREAYGSIFITTLVLGFSPSIDGNTTIEVELVFNNTASPEVTISTADVLETMTTAATNTSAGGISFDPESIVVTVEATISKPFTAELTNQTTAEFQELQTTVVTFCDAIFREAYGSIFITTLVLGFSPSIDGNTTIEVELVFNNTASPEVTISTADVLETMTTAATNTSAGGISFDPESIVVTETPTSTTAPTTTTATPDPSVPTVSFTVEATISKPFTAELTNQTTAEFQELQTTVVTFCDAIFREAYGSIFITTLVLGFSPSIDGNTTIEVELVFNNTASPEVTISTADVLETMTTAATNTSAGGISFDPESIVVTVEATRSKPFTAELTNQTTAEFQELQTTVVTFCDAIFREAYGSIFITTLVLGFSPSIDGNTTIEVELVFNNTASPEVTISTADVLETMTTAATNTSAGGISFDPESIVVTETPTSTTAPTTTTATPDPSVPTVSFTVEATISKPFTAELTNQTTAEFQELQTTVVTFCDAIFREAYGSIFITTLVLGFSPSIDGNTTIEVELVFNNTASPEVTISTADVLETMTTAATNTSAGGISFDPESIVVTETPTSTTAPTTTTATPDPSVPTVSFTVEATISKPFTAELTNQTTAEFQELQTTVVTFCDAIFREAYGSIFITTLVLGFSPSIDGNTTIEVELVFNNTASPEVTISTADVLETMTMAATNTSAGGISFDPESVVVTEATISKPFTAELTNQTTAEFQELQTTVVTFCDAIFREAYGSIFITTLVLGFSPSIDGNTTIEVELVFNNTASPEVTISTADVLETMTTAATNTSAGGISFDPESIVVTETPTSTTAPTTTTATPDPSVPTVSFTVEATISKPFTAELTNQTTAEFQELQTTVVTFCDAIFREAYGSIFITTLVLGFSPSIDGNTTIEVELVFNNTASPEVTISTADVLETMTTAATNTSAGGISFDPESIVVTETPTSTTAPTTTTATPDPSVPTVSFTVEATISKPFTAELTNQTTAEFQELQTTVVTFCDAIFREAYGSIFITTLVLGFSPSIDGNTTIEVELVFNNTASPEVTISTADVLETMTTAATNTSAGGISFDPESIVVTETPTSTTAPTTTTATPDPSVPTVSFTVEATISKPFTAELTNQTTAEFQELQTTVVTFCDAIFREAYGSIFITTLVLGFSPSIDGNTTIEVELVFNNTASPEVTISTADVLETMTTAATNTSAGGISFDPESIVVTGMVTFSIFHPMIKVTALFS